MSHISFKKLSTGMTLAVLLVLQLPTTAFATADTVSAAAHAGVSYLAKNQNSDGSISGFGGETEWSIIALEASGQRVAAVFNNGGATALDFLAANPPAATASATDVERKILAIAASGNSTANFSGLDYNTRLKTYHSDSQIGDKTLLNDDIFGIIAVDATNDTTLYAMAQDGLNYLLAHQLPDGGFSYTTNTCDFYCGSDSNDTAAAIIAMQAASDMGLTNANLAVARDKALTYLMSTQQSDGGFGYDAFSPSDGSSTAWSLMALNLVGSSLQTQATSARDWLLKNQNVDGGFSYGAYGISSSDTFTTAHAVLALFGTTWLLRPTPIQASPAPVPSNTNVAVPPSANVSQGPDPVVPPAPSQPVVSSLPSIPTSAVSTTPEVPPTQPTSGVEGISQTYVQSASDSPEPLMANTSSKPRYTLYSLPILLLSAVGWYMIQSRKGQGV